MTDELSRQQVQRALSRLADGWPDDLVLLGGDGAYVTLIERSALADGQARTSGVIGTYRIANDGGDPDWINDEQEASYD